MPEIPVIYAAQHPVTKRWYVDTDKSTVRRVAFDSGAEVLMVDVPALLRLATASERLQAAFDATDEWDGSNVGAQGIIAVRREARSEFRAALAALNPEP